MIGVSGVREWIYQKKLLKPVELPAFTVSVGNISLGGTGKSAFVMLLAEWASARRIPTLVLSRGYKRKTSALRIVSPNADLPDAAEIGDEPWMIKHRVPGISLLVHADRGRMALRHWNDVGKPRLVLLDDAFQHWRCARDLDVLMIDASESLEQRRLPLGRLRETVLAARRADLIVITRANSIAPDRLAALELRLREASMPRTQPVWKRQIHKIPRVIAGDYMPTEFRDAQSGQAVQPETGREYLLVSGIAKPDHLRAVVKQAGLRVVEEIYFPDHHRLSAGETEQIRKSLGGLRDGVLLVTEKDWGRWRSLFKNMPGIVVRVEFSFLANGAQELEGFLEEVAKGAGCSTLP